MPPRKKSSGSAVRSHRSARARCTQLLVLMGLMLVTLAVRLVWIQVVEASALTAQAQRQRLRDIPLPPRRGTIFDREGQPLAVTVDAKTIYAVPSQVEDATKTAGVLAEILGGKSQDFLPKLHRKSSFVYIARKVDIATANKLQGLEIDGLGFLDDSRRSYPAGSLACQVLGFVGVDDNGLAGMEKQYEQTLAGTPGRIVAERDPRGHLIPGGIVTAQDPVDGQDIYLTIDKDIQYQAQRELATAVRKFSAKSGSIVVMDPRSGEILAMASTPYYDPNDFREAEPDAMRNKAITDAYEPGSTIKAITAASVIDAGLFTPQSMFTLPPTLRVGSSTIHEAHGRGTVRYSLTDIVTKSSNIGAVKIGQALGKKRLADYFQGFRLSRRTGVDFPGEASGWMPPAEAWSAASMANIPFGQGLSVTPLQLARSMAVIANGGTAVTPHFLHRQASITATFPASGTPVISSQAASATTRMLTNVVREGTGQSAAVKGYEVAGKTGTAQKVRSGGLGYMHGVYVASFAGFIPAGDPKLVVIVTIDSPSKGLYGGTVAAPAFSKVAAFSVAHLRIPPAKTVGPTGNAKKAGKAGNKKVSAGRKAKGVTTPVVESTASVQ